MEIIFNEIGVIKTQFEEKKGIPIQAIFGTEFDGTIELYPEYSEGLKDLDGFSHIHLFYYFNNHNDYSLCVKPYFDDTERGLFSTRAPKRPNGIGLSLVELFEIKKNIIYFKGVDMMNNTPLLDIKPYVGKFDSRENAKYGWYEAVKNKKKISDNRF